MLIAVSGAVLAQQWSPSVVHFSSTANTFTYSVYIKNTGASNLAFLAGQQSFNFNNTILNGGTMTCVINSGIDAGYLRKPLVVTASSGKIVFQANLPLILPQQLRY
jgi:hypothetical protein